MGYLSPQVLILNAPFVAIPVVVILLGVVLSQATSVFGRRTKRKMSYTVKWGRERCARVRPCPCPARRPGRLTARCSPRGPRAARTMRADPRSVS